jgi:hypothetical protein
MALATAPTTSTGTTGSATSTDTTVPESLASSTEAAALSSAIDVIARFVSGFEAGRYAGQDAATLVAWFTRAERLCAAGKTLAAARVAESRGHLRSGHRTPAEWLASVTGESMGEAIDVLELADTFRDHPDVDQAFRGGKLSRAGAKLVAGAVRVNPDAGEKLVDGAQHDTLRQLRQRCLDAKAEGRSEADAARAHAAIRAKRRCRTWTDTDGAFRLDALLTPDAGAALAAALAVESDRRFAEARTAGHRESGECYAADALVALVTAPRGDDPTGPTTAGGGAGGARALVTLRVDLDALRSGTLGPSPEPGRKSWSSTYRCTRAERRMKHGRPHCGRSASWLLPVCIRRPRWLGGRWGNRLTVGIISLDLMVGWRCPTRCEPIGPGS